MHRIVLILLLGIVIASCQKTKTSTSSPATPKVVVPTYDISWTINLNNGIPLFVERYTFAFTSTAPDSATVLWNFGDGTTSTDHKPSHELDGMGAYAISLTVNGDTVHTTRKLLNIEYYLPHYFSWTGPRVMDSSLKFSSTVSPDSAFHWDFGDGTASADSAPQHAFHAAGTYSVTLTVNNDAATSVTLPVTVSNAPLYTHLLAGMRLWHDTVYNSAYGTSYYKPDTSFQLTYINPTQISMNGRSMYYLPQSSNDRFLVFLDKEFDRSGVLHELYATFDHNTNYMTVSQYDQIRACCGITETWTSP